MKKRKKRKKKPKKEDWITGREWGDFLLYAVFFAVLIKFIYPFLRSYFGIE